MIIRGRFFRGAPYFAVRVQSAHFRGPVWLLADTGASVTTLLDRDVAQLGVPLGTLTPAPTALIGIGGTARSYHVPDVQMIFTADTGDCLIRQNLWVLQHELHELTAGEANRILRLPSVLGRDVINQFRFVCDYAAGAVELRRDRQRSAGPSRRTRFGT